MTGNGTTEISWMVTIGSYLPVRIVAPTSRKARWRAYQAFNRDVARISLTEFLHRGVAVRIATAFEAETEPETEATLDVVNRRSLTL